ncbi:MAG: hypothetical protein E7563_00130 [Ruminococcaceae bacterium]|nr:hypothetical protein [Oscillospiraceae bacterium]
MARRSFDRTKETDLINGYRQKFRNHVFFKHLQRLSMLDNHVGIDHAVKFRVPLEKVESVSVFSDGFAQVYEVFGIYENSEILHNEMSNKSLKEICDILFAQQDKDPLCNEHPRFKLRDDTCAVYALVE